MATVLLVHGIYKGIRELLILYFTVPIWRAEIQKGEFGTVQYIVI